MFKFLSSRTQKTRASRVGKGQRPAKRSPKIERLESRELLDAGGFVTNLYQDLMHRLPGAQELNSWQAFLKNGGTTAQAARAFVGSEEYRSIEIQSDYQLLLGRQGSSSEVSSWLHSTLGTDQIRVQFLGSNEYYANQGATAEGWLSGVYQQALGRGADQTSSVWISKLSSGASLLSVADAVTSSTEARAQEITDAYKQFLGRTPEGQGLQSWQTMLNQGGTSTDLVVGITGSTEYANKSTSSVEYVTQPVLSAEYTNKSASTGSGPKLNSSSGSTTNLTSSPGVATLGQTVTFTATVKASQGGATPTGSVSFLDGATYLGNASLSSGKAILSLSSLAVGMHSVTAVFQGSSKYASSTSNAVAESITPILTATALTSSASPAVLGQPITFNAVVAAAAPGAGTPSGSVAFMDGTTSLGSASLSSGQATISVSTLALGSHSITAVYQGSTNFSSSTASAFGQLVTQAATTTTLTSSATPAVFGQPITFKAFVAAVAGAGTPTGSIAFMDGTTSLGSASLSSGQATFTISTLSVGTHSVTAVYQGDTNFASSTTATFGQVINQAATATTMTSSASPLVFGQTVTFKAVVAAVAPGAGTPSGSVVFMDGTTSLGSATLASGQATFAISTLSMGTHSITAVYQGSSSFASSTTATFGQVINQASTATTLTSSATPTVFGQPITFKAVVAAATGAGTSTGSVAFMDGTTSLGSATLASGQATFTISTLTVGAHSITADYQGSSGFASSTTATFGQVINQAATATTLTSSASLTAFGQAVTFKAIVATVAPGTGTPTGSVTFLDGATSLGSASLSSGQASFTISTLALGSHSITAVYQGSTNFVSSKSSALGQTVNLTASATTLISSASPTVFGQAVTFKAIVAAVAPGTGTPTGSVVFMDGTTSLGSASLSSGQATFTISTLTVGTHSITAVYQGDTNFASSTTATLGQVINQAATATTLTSSASPSVYGQSVILTATVSAVSAGAGTPGGSVTFLDGTTSLGSATLANGKASLTLSTLAVGTHTLSTVYGGSTNFLSSTSSAMNQQVSSALAVTNTVVASSIDPVVVGQAVTFTAAAAPAVSGSGIPTGSITFTIDGVAQPAVPLVNGLATLSVSTLAAGNHSIVGAYSGDTHFQASRSTPFTEVSNSTYTAPWQPPGLNVTKYGVVGDGVTDNTASLQNLINSSPVGTLFYFPAGTYLVAGTVSFGGLRNFGIEGDTTSSGQPASTIKGTALTGNAVSADYGSGNGTFQIQNMQFVGSDAGETAFFTNNAVSASFDNCTFSGHIGLNLLSGFEVAVRSSKFIGHGGAAGSHIGLLAWGPTECLVSGSDFSGWDEGLRAAGAGISIIRSTFEQNGTGMNLGVDPDGNTWILCRSSFNNLSMTANSVAIVAKSLAFCYFSDITIQGSANAPSGQSQVGLQDNYAQGCIFSGLQITGGFSQAAVRVVDSKYTAFYNCDASNSIATGQLWSVATGLTGVTFNSSPMGAIADVDNDTANEIVAGAQASVLNVTSFGLVGDGVKDNTAALQALINSAAPGTTFYFPLGTYKVSATIDFSRLSSFTILGDGASAGGSTAGSTIVGSFAGVLLKADYGTGAGTFQIHNMNLRSVTASGGLCLFARNAVLSNLQDVQVTGNIGIEIVNPFMCSVSSVQFNGSLSSGSNIGLLVVGGSGCTVEACDFMGWQEGLRASGSGLDVFACRFETNHIGMNLGIDINGNLSPLQNASFAGISMEANDIAINAKDCINSSFEAIGAQGSTNAPSGLSQVGLNVGACQGCTFSAIGMGGSYSNTAVVVSSAASNLLFDACSGSNGVIAGAWDVQSSATNITLRNCY
jgi:hypothetical protein